MFNMFDLFRQAQGGAAFDNLARAYGMSPEQMRAAAAAVTPAFMQGMIRQSQSDEAARRFLALFNTEAYARAFEAQAAALDPSTRKAGDNALDALFGSEEVSRAVSAQAAAVSGVQAEIIRKVLPTLASILVGGFMKAAQGAGSPGGSGSAPGKGGDADAFDQMADFWRQMMGQQKAAPEPDPEPRNPQNPFQDWIDGWTKAAAPSEQKPDNPLGDMMADTLNTMFGGTQKAAAPEPEPEAPPPPPEPEASAEKSEPDASPFDDMIATGREMSAQNAKAMEQIFDAFFKAQQQKG